MRRLVHVGVDARRRRDRRGREGRGADAVQRRARRRRRRARRSTSPSTPSTARRCAPRACPTRCRCWRSSERGSMFDPSAVFYMEKLVTGPEAAGVVDIDAPRSRTTSPRSPRRRASGSRTSPSASSTGRGTSGSSPTIRATGARIKFITDGDVAGAIMAAREGTGIDLLVGIGGTPEGDHLRLRHQVPRRRDPGPALAEGRRRAAAAPSTPATTSTACCSTDDLVDRRQRLLRRHRHHRRRAAARRPLPRPRVGRRTRS